MVYLLKMKYYKTLIIYLLIVFGLYQFYDPATISQILVHYPYIDLRYLFFICIQFFWITVLFQYVYQYISLYTLISLRLTKRECIHLYIVKFAQFSLFYYLLHVTIFLFFSLQIPFFLLSLNLFIGSLSLAFIIPFQKTWDYSYIFIIIMMICIQFVV